MRNIVELIPRMTIVADFLGFNLELARESKGLTQSQLAEKVGTIQSTISKWENEKAHPPKEYWEILTNILDLPDGFFQREWHKPVGTYDLDEVLKEWKTMAGRMERLEQRFGPENVLRAQADPFRADSPMNRFTSLLADADLVTLFACLYLLSGSKQDLEKVHSVIRDEVVALRQHIRPLRSSRE